MIFKMVHFKKKKKKGNLKKKKKKKKTIGVSIYDKPVRK